jgi:YD repeat-containing protein
VTALAKWNVHGAVRSLRTEFAEWDLTLEQWRAAHHFTLVRFRPDGAISESEHHNPDGSIVRSGYAYDAAGRMQEVRFGMNDDPTSRSIYSYDESGRLTRVFGMDQDGAEHESEVYSYGNDRTKTKVYFVPKHVAGSFMYAVEGTAQHYGAPGATTVTTRYEAGGNPGEVLFHDEGRRLLRRVVYTRDDAGRLMKEEMLAGEQSPFADIEDEAAREALAKLFGPEHVISSTTYTYDAKGRTRERRTRMGEVGEHRTIFRYDDRGNPAEETHEEASREMDLNDDGNLQVTKERSSKQNVRFEYQYDAQGNWLEQVVWGRMEPNPNFERSNITRREIAYYAG